MAVRIRSDFSNFAVVGLVGADTSAATDADRNSAIAIPSRASDIAPRDVRCEGTDPSVGWVEYEAP